MGEVGKTPLSIPVVTACQTDVIESSKGWIQVLDVYHTCETNRPGYRVGKYRNLSKIYLGCEPAINGAPK